VRRGTKAVAAACALIGARFVPQGRDAARGVDCIGLVIHTYDLPVTDVSDDYRMSGDHRSAIVTELSSRFRRVSRQRLLPADLLLCRPGERQFHLMIWSGESVIHADARRQMVVERPGAPEWPVVAAFRARVRQKKGS